MGRGAKEQVRKQADTMIAGQQARGTQADTARTATGGQLQTAAGELTGYTPQEQSSMAYTPESAAKLESSMVGAAAEPFAGAQQSIARNVARTRNSAGAAGAIGKAAMGRSTAAGNAALNVNNIVEGRRQQVAEGTAQSRMQAQSQKISALASQYGIDTNLLQNLLGLPVSTLGISAGTTQRNPISLGPLGTYG